MKGTLRKIWAAGGVVILALSAMVLTQPAVAAHCSAYPENRTVRVDEGETAKLTLKVKCDTRGWSFKRFRYAYSTKDGTTTNGDYRYKSGSHEFTGQTGSTTERTISIETYTDNLCEDTEKFRVVYELEGFTKAGWTDWSHGVHGLPGKLRVRINLRDDTAGCS